MVSSTIRPSLGIQNKLDVVQAIDMRTSALDLTVFNPFLA